MWLVKRGAAFYTWSDQRCRRTGDGVIWTTRRNAMTWPRRRQAEDVARVNGGVVELADAPLYNARKARAR